LEKKVRKKKYKRSRQRERILEIVRTTNIHPTASWIYERLKEEIPGLSMGTVYRNLNILIDQGFVRKIDFGSTFDRFEANIEPHYHFICEKCGEIFDLDLPIDASLNEMVNKKTQFSAKRHRIEFYGLCDRCAQKQREER
jgi:Fur family peroxide stress response transcriptional regulator